MIHYRWYRSGDLFGMRYDFEHGDALPTHAHDTANEHNVIVLDGMVEVQLPNHKKFGARGDVIDFDSSQIHTIRCLSRNATTLHLWLRGIPEGYADLPESEHQGTL